MAEEKKPFPKTRTGSERGPRSESPRRSSPGASDERLTEILFLVLIVGALLSSVSGFVKSHAFRAYFIRIFPQSSLSYYDSATGARIYVSAPLGNVRESPGGVRIGSQTSGAVGTVLRGPETVIQTRFWDVNFVSDPDGWMDESEILLVKPETFLSRLAALVVTFFKILSTLMSLVFLSGIVYSLIRVSQVMSGVHKKEKQRENPVYVTAATQDHVNRRWDRVIAHVQSESPADWRISVLEADIMLAELLDKMGYIGENVGEKLKRIEKSDFETIDDAWEAHKTRNLIAHQGSDFVLSKREAQRVIGLYANVFREFRYI